MAYVGRKKGTVKLREHYDTMKDALLAGKVVCIAGCKVESVAIRPVNAGYGHKSYIVTLARGVGLENLKKWYTVPSALDSALKLAGATGSIYIDGQLLV